MFTLLSLKRKKFLSTLLLPTAHGKVTNLTEVPNSSPHFTSHIRPLFLHNTLLPHYSASLSPSVYFQVQVALMLRNFML